MRHALMYHGSFEANFPARAGAETFRGSDGADHPIPSWPQDVDGMRIGYLEKPGKKFVAARVQFEDEDIPLSNPVVIDPPRHMGYGNRFGPEATIIQDETARYLIEDIIAKNPEQREQLWPIRDRVRGRTQGSGER